MKYFIGGVARAYLYSGNTMVMSSNTLINSSIEISTDAVEARGGEGNKLLGKYFHTSTVAITFEDQIFNLDYVARNVGAPKQLGHSIYKNEEVVVEAGSPSNTGLVTGTPAPFIGTSTIGWVHPIDDPEDITTVTFSGSSFPVPALVAGVGDTICIMYPEVSLGAEYIDIPANIIPDTLHCVLVAKLYRASGEAMDLASSSVVGTVTIDIPRLQFSGAQTISMSSTGVSTTPLTGNALAIDTGTCDGAGTYATFVVNINEGNWYDKVIALACDDGDIDDLAIGDTRQLKVYGIANGVAPFVITSGLTFQSSDESLVTVSGAGQLEGIADGTAVVTVSITSKPTVVCNVTVAVPAL